MGKWMSPLVSGTSGIGAIWRGRQGQMELYLQLLGGSWDLVTRVISKVTI